MTQLAQLLMYTRLNQTGSVSLIRKYMINLFLYFITSSHLPIMPPVMAQSQPVLSAALYANAIEKTASQEPYDPNAFTIAHRDLPFQTKLKLVCVATSDTISVVVNDRVALKDTVDFRISSAVARVWKAENGKKVAVQIAHIDFLPASTAANADKSVDKTSINANRLVSSNAKTTETKTSARVIQSGVASYYGPGFHGRRTANGERFNQYGLTAAHRSLPFGTRLRVTNMRNGRSVIVRVNDRGPYSGGRILDLSTGAARAIGISGTGRVQLARVTANEQEEEQVTAKPTPVMPQAIDLSVHTLLDNNGKFSLQLASFLDKKDAELEAKKLNGAWIETEERSGWAVHRVLFGHFNSPENANVLLNLLKNVGFTGFIRTL
jgi:rare lipoprotein A